MSRSQVFEWFGRFKRGEMSVEDHARSGRPSTSRNDENVEKIRQKINEDRRFTIDEISEETGVSWSSCQRILTEDLKMRRVAAHKAFRVNRYLASQGWSVVPHPPYSPDLAPCDFFLFPRMKKNLKGKRFDDVEAVKTASQRALDDIKVEEFQRCFKQWEKRLDKCIAANGEYFEGD